MAPNFLSLPRELIDLCVDKLHENDNEESRTALRACSLVCRTLCHRSRSHLFRHISFSSQSTAKLIPRLHTLPEILGSTLETGIARYVKSFEIIIDSAAENASTDFSSLLRDPDGILCAIINALHGQGYGVRKFSLGMSSSPPTKIGFVEWSDLTPSFQESMFDLVKSPALTFLHIGNIYGLPSTFLRNTRLEHLHLSHTGFSSLNKSPGESENGELTPPALGCVTMNPADCLTGIAGGYLFHLTRLKTFTSTIFSVSHMYITWEAMKASAGSIEALQLDFYESFPPPPQPFDLGQMHKLQNLALTHTVLMPDEEIEITTAQTFDEDVEHIYALLDTPTPATALKRLDIMITSWQIFPGEDFFAGLHESSRWHMIDSLLTSPKFPALFTVDLFLSLPMLVEQARTFDQKVFKTKVSDFFKKVLPRLSASKKITLGVDVQVILFGWGEDTTTIDDNGEEVVFANLLT